MLFAVSLWLLAVNSQFSTLNSQLKMTTQEIYDKIILEKEKYPELNELNSNSKTAVWRLWCWIFAFFSKTMWELFGDLKSWIIDFYNKQQIGTLAWWDSEVRKFQYNSILEYIDGRFRYRTIDKKKQIIKQLAIKGSYASLLFKVAKYDNNNNLTALTETEQESLLGYINQIKLPGLICNVYSGHADKLTLNYRIYYNMSYSTAKLQKTIKEAIVYYLDNVVFNGEISPTFLTDEIQKVTGVTNPIFVAGSIENDNTTVELADKYTALSGYYKLKKINIEFIADA